MATCNRILTNRMWENPNNHELTIKQWFLIVELIQEPSQVNKFQTFPTIFFYSYYDHLLLFLHLSHYLWLKY